MCSSDLLLTYMTEQTFRENVLKPFEMTVKGFDFDNYVMGMMTSYNWIGSVPVISDANLLKTVLREEWGFVGTVISDYNGSYGYQISDAAVRAGNDLMLGYGMAESNQLPIPTRPPVCWPCGRHARTSCTPWATADTTPARAARPRAGTR